MRQIKFRWRALSDWRWVYGYYRYISETNTHQIIWWELLQAWADIDPDTLGQLTWLHDKNWKEIYEGDIVKDLDDRICKVKWFDDEARFIFVNIDDEDYDFDLATPCYREDEWVRQDTKELEVIWNIYENPELLNSHQS